MIQHGMTVKEAAERWVQEMNAFSYDMIEKLFDDWSQVTELTMPSYGDRVYVYEPPEGCNSNYGEITRCPGDEDDEIYLISMDDGPEIEVKRDDFEREVEGGLPMWGTLWSFGDGCDDYWLSDCDGIRKMSQCGFRIYEHEEYGYFFGIDGAGYSFYDEHWIPLYKARGLEWHDPETEKKDYVMSDWRRADYYKKLLGFVKEQLGDTDAVVEELRKLGFSERDLQYEGLLPEDAA